ncbi:family 16 glycosylhydrolase [Cellulophaga baltica]|uniref:Glycosyl hydrolases family 16 n=1 Tax=Cellulophaga baltica TaxID=76594 RepID=A0A1G7JI53_9FLAO|nr:family 16 glycosylhydrolase [Cellulophaga baltica]SDF24600.1 Glycosyl hydrolases family 16 [Cellulophaga baltica]
MKNKITTMGNAFRVLMISIFLGSCSSQHQSASNEPLGEEKTVLDDVSAPESTDVAFLPNAGAGKTWTIQAKVSNEFNDTEGKQSEKFSEDWHDGFFNGWTGPGITKYTAAQSSIEDGELLFKATIDNGIIKTGCITSKAKATYPLYMEVRVKLSESVLSSVVWMLSDDSTEEIDNLEAFGAKSNDYFSKRLHLSHHVFIREPFQDYQPTGTETWYADSKNTIWSEDYHKYGVLWENPWNLSYYVDGVLVRKTPIAEIDPERYTDGMGLTKPMHMIISAAAQSWRETQGINFLTDPTVTNEEKTVMKVDWIRVYKPE